MFSKRVKLFKVFHDKKKDEKSYYPLLQFYGYFPALENPGFPRWENAGGQYFSNLINAWSVACLTADPGIASWNPSLA